MFSVGIAIPEVSGRFPGAAGVAAAGGARRAARAREQLGARVAAPRALHARLARARAAPRALLLRLAHQASHSRTLPFSQRELPLTLFGH